MRSGATTAKGARVVDAVPGDDAVPNVARIYDYLLGGSHNFSVDREQADRILAARPGVQTLARANRSFLRHAVGRLLDRGLRQFLDLGSGIPTVGNVHEIAHARDAGARVAYVDCEAVAVAHSRAILADVPTASITAADYREPEVVLAAPGVADLLDFSRPIALLAVTALHFVPDEDEPGPLLARYRRALPPGSALAMTHGSADYPDHPEFVEAHRRAIALYDSTSNPIRLRSRAEIEGILSTGGFRPDVDGLVDVGRWNSPPLDEPLGAYAVISEPLA